MGDPDAQDRRPDGPPPAQNAAAEMVPLYQLHLMQKGTVNDGAFLKMGRYDGITKKKTEQAEKLRL